MDLNESYAVASPQELTKRSQEEQNLLETETTENPTHIRFLISNASAGSVIGKGGSTITDFQAKSGARIQLSRNQEFFPGTTDRIIMMSGTISEVVNALELVLDKLNSELHSEDGGDAEPRRRVRLVVPNSSCGSIIGKGGATIKSFIEESKASIKISPLDNTYYGLNDRLVTLTGTLEEQMRAVDLILSKLTEDAHYSQNVHAPYTYAGLYYGAAARYTSVNYASNGAGAKFQSHKEDASHSVTMGVSDEHVGLVLGRGGRHMGDIIQMTGARVKISDRGDFITGTTDRKVTITGSERGVKEAEEMIKRKVASASTSASERASD